MPPRPPGRPPTPTLPGSRSCTSSGTARSHNPRGVLYGRIPGYHLSDDGRLMAKAAADYLAGRDVTVLRSSPLQRAVETAEPIAAELGLEVEVDDRLIEPWNYFEGMRFGVGDGALRKPRHWLALRNPFRPSWGEPYQEVAARVLAAVTDAATRRRRSRGGLRQPSDADLDRPPVGRGPQAVARPARAASARSAASPA